MKQHRKIIIFSLIVIIIILFLGVNYLKYISVEIKNDISDNEFSIITSEYNLNINQEDMIYLYNQGSERYGIRLILNEYTAQHINDILNINVNMSALEEYLMDDSWYDYKTSSNDYVSAKVVSFCFPSEIAAKVSAYVFKENGKYYLEIEKNTTDNISIFQVD